MSSVEVRDMLPEDEYFVSTCTHENESDEIDASARRRLAWLRFPPTQSIRWNSCVPSADTAIE